MAEDSTTGMLVNAAIHARFPPAKKQNAAPGGAASCNSHTMSGEHAVFLEPGLELVPAILRRVLAIARAVVGVEAVWRAGIDVEFCGLAGRLELPLHLFHL